MAAQQQDQPAAANNEQTMLEWRVPPRPAQEKVRTNTAVDMGWGRLLFGQTFESNQQIADTLLQESKGRRDIAFYLNDPHVVLSLAPHRLFLDPSHTYRMWRSHYQPSERQELGYRIRPLESLHDAEGINRIYAARHMVTCDPQFMMDAQQKPLLSYLVAQHAKSGEILGVVTGVDHIEAFDDPDRGASLWCLAVDPQCQLPGVGEMLVRKMVEKFFDQGREYVDLSVMHDNRQAITLYEKLGFERVQIFCVKHKNPINEPLFTAPQPEEKLNPYAEIIVNEARRRGIAVEVLDEEAGYFRLTRGARSIVCRESLTELTTAIAMSRCDDKRVTRRILEAAGLNVPAQQAAGEPAENEAFLHRHHRIVVKPARGEQGTGISVDVRTAENMAVAIDEARHHSKDVILEQMVEGDDLRVVVIDHQVVAAAIRRPAVITSTGKHTVTELIEKYNRRREAATSGESHVPLDDETARCVEAAGYGMDDVPPAGQSLTVRKSANLHTGGTIHDVTAQLHPELAKAAVIATKAIDIPVAGLDFIVPRVDGTDYVIIEVNERVGLANHEPQPTAERFVDFLFPSSTMEQQ